MGGKVRATNARLVRGINETAFLRETTKEQYRKALEKAVDVYGKSSGSSYAAIMSDPAGFADKVLDHARRSGRGSHWVDGLMAAVMALWNYNQDLREKHAELFLEWQEQKRRTFAPIALKYKSNEPTEKQKEAYVSYERLVEIRDALEPGSDARLLLFMYTEIPPVRSDYYCTRIYATPPRDGDDCGNYLVLPPTARGGPARLVLQEYKTSKRYNKIVTDLPPAVVAELRASLARQPRDHVFVSRRTGVGFRQRHAFNVWANALLREVTGNPNITLTMLRHVFVSRRDLALHTLSGVEQDRIARAMGHSVGMQRGYSWHAWERDTGKR